MGLSAARVKPLFQHLHCSDRCAPSVVEARRQVLHVAVRYARVLKIAKTHIGPEPHAGDRTDGRNQTKKKIAT